MAAVSDIVLPALQAVGIRYFGLPAGADETDTAISELNSMLASWSNSWSNMFPYDAVAPFAGDGSTFRMGTDPTNPSNVGDFPERPATIQAVFVQQGDPASGGLSWEIPIGSLASFHEIRYPAVSAIPRKAFRKPGFPFDTLYLYPRLMSGYSVRVVGSSYLPSFATLADVVLLPPQYIEAAKWELARRIAPLFGAQLDDRVDALAAKAMKHIQIENASAKIRQAPNDMMGSSGAGWNYLAGWGF